MKYNCMNIYLNDLSLQSKKSIMENIPFIKDFIKLIENLSSVGNISLNASHNLW